MSLYVPVAEVSSVGLYVLGAKDNRIDSHVRVKHQELFRTGLPHPNGGYDPHMGSTSSFWDCESCLHRKKLCPGHAGSYQLHVPVPSPMFIKEIVKWLKVICFQCGKLIVKETKFHVPTDKILSEYVKLTRTVSKNILCVHCETLHPHIVKDKADPISIFAEIYEPKSVTASSSGKFKLLHQVPLYPQEIAKILKRVEPETVALVGKPLVCHPKKFMLITLRVPPNTIRPDVQKMNAGRSNSNDLTILLQTIMKINEQIPAVLPDVVDHDLHYQIHLLCLAVFDLIRGSTGTNKRGIVSSSKKPLTAICKRFPRKYGRIRRNLMGRRADYMGRSFIIGDSFCQIGTIGIPLIAMARKIQYPMIVREYNYKESMKYFMNGAE